MASQTTLYQIKNNPHLLSVLLASALKQTVLSGEQKPKQVRRSAVHWHFIAVLGLQQTLFEMFFRQCDNPRDFVCMTVRWPQKTLKYESQREKHET